MWWEGLCAGMPVVAVDVGEAVDVDAADGANRAEAEGATTDDGVYAGSAPCWGRAMVEETSLVVDDGGDGKREATLLIEGCCELDSAGL